MKALLVLLLCLPLAKPVPSQKSFHIHVTYVERTSNGYAVRAQNGMTIYRMHCSLSGESCHMLSTGIDYLADNSKPAGNLVVYGVDEDSAVYVIDSEQAVTK